MMRIEVICIRLLIKISSSVRINSYSLVETQPAKSKRFMILLVIQIKKRLC